MSDSFGAIIYVDSNSVSGDLTTYSFGPPTYYAVTIAPTECLGPPTVFTASTTEPEVAGNPFIVTNSATEIVGEGPPSIFDLPPYAMGILFMSNLIQAADQSNINVGTVTLSDRTGTGNMQFQPPNGASYQFRGMRIMTENRLSDWEIPLHKTGYMWTNTGAGALSCTLPTGAPQGFMAYIVRTGGQINITPPSTEKIEFGDNANVKPSGAAALMTGSGSIIGLVKDEGTRWVRMISFGTVT